MKKLVSLFAFCAVVAISSFAQAGVMGHAILDISNLKLTILSGPGTTPRTATGSIQNLAAPIADISVSSVTTDATNTSSLTGFANGLATGGFSAQRSFLLNGVPTINGPFDAGAAVSGNLLGDYTRSDSSFGGSWVDFSTDPYLNSVVTGASANTTADFSVGTAGLLGSAATSVTNNSSLKFSVSQDVTARLDWTGVVDLLLSDSGTPPNFLTKATTSFSLAITQTSNGQGVALGNVTADLNRSIQLPPGTSPKSSNNGPNPVAYQTNVFTLVAGASYTLSINQTSSIEISQVPEPASCAVFGLLGVGALVVARRNRKS